MVEEEDFFRPSEKGKGEAKEGDDNMSQRGDDERGRGKGGGVRGGERLVDNRRDLLTRERGRRWRYICSDRETC